MLLLMVLQLIQKIQKISKKNLIKNLRLLDQLQLVLNLLKKRSSKFNAVEIMTGAIIPNGFDTIIPIEQIVFFPNKENAKYILVNKKITKYNHVRFKGSDYKKAGISSKKKYNHSA
jgi:molybdopterin molybdotransferase